VARQLRSDRILFGAVLALSLFGLVMVYSASAVIATSRPGGTPYFFVLRQAQALVAGFLLALLAMTVDYRRWRSSWLLGGMLGISALMLIAVLFQPRINNTHRWLNLGPLSLQPSELAKIPLVIFLAHWLDSRRERMEDIVGTLLPAAAILGGFTVLVMIEPDFGTAVIYLVVGVVLLFAAGLPFRYFAGGALAVVPVLAFWVTRADYRLRRISSFLNPEADPLGDGFQAWQSLIAHGTGGTIGAGLGDGRQKLFFLPEPHTDFVFSIIGEELGLVGALVVLAVFAVVFWRALRAAIGAPDRYGYYLALGLGSLVFIQALTHMSVTLAMLPTKGLPLPFISYGRSFLVTCLVAAGLLLNVSQHQES
jgi:cell division protein FtsW